MAKFFHGTSSENLKSIKENGLVGGTNLTEKRNKNLDLVFLTTNYQSALGYAGRSKSQRGGQAIILEIETTKAVPWKNKRQCSIFTAKHIRNYEIISIHEI